MRWLDHSLVPTAVLRDGKFVYANPAFATLVGASAQEILGSAASSIAALRLDAPRARLRIAGRHVDAFCAPDGEDVVVQLVEQADAARVDRLVRLIRLGVEAQAGKSTDAIFVHVSDGLAKLGVAGVRFIVRPGALEIADVRFPGEAEVDVNALVGGALRGRRCGWHALADAALREGVAFVEDAVGFSLTITGVLDEARAREIAARWNLEHAVIVRVDTAGEPQLWLLTASFISREDVPALALLGAQLSAANEAGRVIGDLFARNASLAAINRLAEVASAASGTEDLFESFGRALRASLVCEVVAVFLVDDAASEVKLAWQHGLELEPSLVHAFPLQGSRLGDVVRTLQPLVFGRESATEPGRRLLEAFDLGAVATVPLVARSKPIGVLAIARRRSNEVGRTDLELMTAAGAHLASAIEANRLFVDLRKSYADLARTQEQLVQRERLAAIGELAAVVAHEVRNPLGVIFNSIGTIRRSLGSDDRARTLVQILEEEATRLNHIVGDLLDFARPRVPTLHRDKVEGVLEEAVMAALSSANVRVVRRVARDLPAVPIDTRLLRQALLNIAQNAVQAMPEGGTLTVRAEQRDGSIQLAIEDTGPGIPPEIRPRIFEPFFTTRARGTGLGLAVVKRIIDGHNGAVDVETEMGKGTTFIVRLPVD